MLGNLSDLGGDPVRPLSAELSRPPSVTRLSHDLLSRDHDTPPILSIVDVDVMVADHDGHAFRHALIRDAACRRLLPGGRVELHARVHRRPAPSTTRRPPSTTRPWCAGRAFVECYWQVALAGAVLVLIGTVLLRAGDDPWDLAWRVGGGRLGHGLFAGPDAAVLPERTPPELTGTSGA